MDTSGISGRFNMAADYTLIDAADKMLEGARLRFDGMNSFDFIVSDYSRELPEGMFDMIASALSIHHPDDTEKAGLYKNIYDKLESAQGAGQGKFC